ncbi:alpha/beta hydrolase [Eisenibacter elegans]|uniref:alpha/beta hydrolase n=1 Tax=Eisenibacter elegans TaxID=997 RepID=UPI00041AC495|nr:dienelactone hydrolase family protein [Eisenibacter elegans]
MHPYDLHTQGTPLAEAQRALVCLHGRGASAESILSLGAYFARPGDHLVAPQAAQHTWYPYSFMAPEAQNEPWLSSAIETVSRLLTDLQAHIPARQIYLLGFSQGACLSLEVAARQAQPLGGVVAFIGGLIGEQLVPERYQGSFEQTPVLMVNSDRDPHVPLERTQASKAIYEQLGANVQLAVKQGMPHTILEEHLVQAQHWVFATKNG